MRLGQIALTSLILLALSSLGSRATTFGDIRGMLTDPLKLGHLGDSVERSLNQLSQLENVANAHVGQRLDQIKMILDDAFSQTNNSIGIASEEINELESSINKDALNFLYEAKCTEQVAVTEDARLAYINLVNDLNKARPGLVVFGFRIVSWSSKEIKIDDPDKAFFTAKDAVFSKLRETITSNTDAYEILSAYQNLEKAAYFTRCSYLHEGLAIRMTEEINDLEVLSHPWLFITKPKHAS